MYWEVPHQTREVQLWQSVVLLAVRDAVAPVSPTHPVNIKRDAERWIRQRSKKYRAVCAMAGVDPDFLADAFCAGRIDFSALKHVLSK